MCLTCLAVSLAIFASSPQDARIQTFPEPIDAMSVGLPSETSTAEVSGFADGRWMEWQALAVENEQDPTLKESNLIVFPSPVTAVRLRGTTEAEIHPIVVSHEPTTYLVAARGTVSRPRILSRADWGADETLLRRTSNSSGPETDTKGDNGDATQTSQRVRDCLEMQEEFSQEFRTTGKTVSKDAEGFPLLWPHTYSQFVRLIAVHHTAIAVGGDVRTGEERMRALYTYHAKNRGWGDIGYHYLIDEDGQIYEGKAGGGSVVGGHAYCNNIGTVGIALMGNFEVEKPTQEQMHSLQWLIDTVSDQYDIDLGQKVIFHGQAYSPVVGHRDLLSTDCPGYYAYNVLGQVLTNARTGAVNEDVRFPVNGRAQSSSRAVIRKPSTSVGELFAAGETTVTGRPGSDVFITMRYRAGAKAIPERASLGAIKKGHPRIAMSVGKGETYQRLGANLNSPQTIRAGETATIRLKVHLPAERGSFVLKIGTVTYTLVSEGRARAGVTPTRETYIPVQRSSVAPEHVRTPARDTAPLANGPMVRIRLGAGRTQADTMGLRTASDARVSGSAIARGNITLTKNGDECQALAGGKVIAQGVVRVDGQGGILTLTTWDKSDNRFRGIIECQIVDGKLTLINELPMEQYLAGLSEEPDTEPYEKQRAFAIAARSYAAFYLQPHQRKFPGKPYDGSDSPAEFQIYSGVGAEERNPRWVQAVQSTSNLVLTKDGDLLKTPYFSSDDGRTRSPSEAGWNTYPHSEVFMTKPDPWCQGQTNRGHGVGMSGCGAEGQANEGKKAEDILAYYYKDAVLTPLR